MNSPFGPVDSHGHGTLAYGGAPVPKRMNHIGAARRAIRGFFSPVEEPAQVDLQELNEIREYPAGEGDRELSSSGRPVDGGRPQEPRD